GADGMADLVVQALADDNGKDALLHFGLVRAVEGFGKTGIERLLALAESGEQKKLNLVVETFTALRTRPAVEAIPHLLKNPHLSSKQRADLVRSYGNYRLDPPVPLAPVLDYLTKHPDESARVKLAGLEVLAS